MKEDTLYNPEYLTWFHHVHFNTGETVIHHCGGGHVKMNPKLDYTIRDCSCGKHRIDKEIAIGHDIKMKIRKVRFTEKCPDGGWHVESGTTKRKKINETVVLKFEDFLNNKLD